MPRLLCAPSTARRSIFAVVASMVQIYSVGYMRGDPRVPIYFGYLSLFTAAMLGLVLAAILLAMGSYLTGRAVGGAIP